MPKGNSARKVERAASEQVSSTRLSTLEEGDKVVVVVRFEAVGRESGAKVELPFLTNVFELSDGLIMKFEAFYSLEEALEATGVSEKDVHADS
jgi:ketosteroid isomerase-like protein